MDQSLGHLEPKHPEGYQEMLRVFSLTQTKKEMEAASVMFVLDMTSSRRDICLAMKNTAKAKGWK